MPTSSIFLTIQKLRILLSRDAKLKCVWIALMATLLSFFEMLTAIIIVLFAQILSQPEKAQLYLSHLGLTPHFSSGRLIFYTALAMGGIYLLKNILAAVEMVHQHFTIQRISYHFKSDILQRYTHMDYGFFLTRNSSAYVEIIGSDIELMFLGMSSLAGLVSESIICLFLVSFIIFMNPFLALVIFSVGGLLGILVQKGLFPLSYRLGQQIQKAGVQAMQNLFQFFQAFKEIILYGTSDVFIKNYEIASLKKSKLSALQQSLNALPRMVIESLFVGLFVLAIAFLCLEKESPVEMIGILAGYLYAGFRLMPGISRIVSQLSFFKGVVPSIEHVYLEYTTVFVRKNYVELPSFSFNKSLQLTNVSFRYFNTTRKALSHITLEIQKGECLGIVGKTGSGKSTLVDLMIGLLHPQEGTLLIDHQYPVNTPQWHRCLGYVPQSIYLIDDTVEKNIFFGAPNKERKRLTEVIDIACLGDFIDQLPSGTKTIVGERGVRLSGGERQRIAIARALYRNPEVLIFDEATSALDQETEASLMEAVRRARQERTVIMVAHRLTTLKDCDRIVVMKEGRIEKITDYQNL